MSNKRNRLTKRLLNSEKATEQDSRYDRITSDRFCVIITQKKNSSWVDDLDALERLNTCRIVYH